MNPTCSNRGAWHRAALHCLLAACAVILASMQFAHAGTRERLSLDAGWRFLQGDVALPAIKGHGASYLNAKAGEAQGPANADYDDSDWRRVDLPHDWAVEGPFDAAQNKSQGYRARGSCARSRARPRCGWTASGWARRRRPNRVR